jgi:hypothetical protein
MDASPSVTDADLAATPASVIALIQWQARQIQRLSARVAELEAQVADLTARLNKDSFNSSVPPSATHPHAKPVTAKAKSKGRNRSAAQATSGHSIPFNTCRCGYIRCVSRSMRWFWNAVQSPLRNSLRTDLPQEKWSRS